MRLAIHRLRTCVREIIPATTAPGQHDQAQQEREHMEVVAWLVIAADGYRSLFLDRVRAEFWAGKCHGKVYALGVCDPA